MSKWSGCKKCSSQNIVKNGMQDKVQRFKCKDLFLEVKKQCIAQILS
jgi:hypothetical protein